MSNEEKLDLIHKLRFSDPQRVAKLTQKWTREALTKENIDFAGIAEFYCGDAYFTMANFDECLIHVHRAISYLTQSENWRMLGSCYNLLGVYFLNQGDNSSAFDSLRAGIDILIAHPDLVVLGVQLYENYSDLCSRIDNLEDAIYYDEKSLEYCKRLKAIDKHNYYYMMPIVLTELTLYNALLKKKSEAQKYMDQLDFVNKEKEAYSKRNEYTNSIMDSRFEEEVMRCVYYNYLNDAQKEAENLREAMKCFRETQYHVDFFGISIYFLNYLYEQGHDELMEEVLIALTKDLDGKNLPDLETKTSRLHIKLLERQKQHELLFEEMRHYINLADKKQKSNNDMLHILMQVETNLNRYQKDVQKLSKEASTDALTEINNRRAYDELSYQTLDECRNKQINLGIELLDIDNFKSINDNYGHQTGDKSLILLADVLKSLENDKITVFRYGGDEFVILYVGMSDEKIEHTARKLKKRLNNHMLDEGPEFTVSQGIVNDIPTKTSRVWDFVSKADISMYNVKKHGGNNHKLAKLA